MLGIDVSKDKLNYCLLGSDRRPLLEGEVRNNAEGIAELLSKIDPKAPMVLEPTGRYGLAAVKTARANGRLVLQAQTIDAKHVLNGLSRRAKTDKLDSRGLAKYGMADDLIRPYPVKAKDVDELDQLLSVRRCLSGSITRFRLQRQSLDLAGNNIDKILNELKAQLKALDAQILSLVKSNSRFEPALRMLDVPGIGPVTAAAACSRLTHKQFEYPDQFVAYIGLALKVIDSGKRAGRRRLEKRGDAELRRLFYMAAQSNIRIAASPFKAQYLKHREKGLSSTAAICAVARKIAMLCWSLHKHGTKYSSERVGARPAPKHDAPSEEEHAQ